MSAYTDIIDLSMVSTAQILLWQEGLNEIRVTYDHQLLVDAGFTIPAAIARLRAELTKRSLRRVYSRPLKPDAAHQLKRRHRATLEEPHETKSGEGGG